MLPEKALLISYPCHWGEVRSEIGLDFNNLPEKAILYTEVAGKGDVDIVSWIEEMKGKWSMTRLMLPGKVLLRN